MTKIDENVKNTIKKMVIGDIIYNAFLLIIYIVIYIYNCYNNKDITRMFIYPSVCGFEPVIGYNNIVEKRVFLELVIGLLIGLIYSICVIFNMAYTLNFAYGSNDEKFARNYIIKYSVIRNISFMIIMILLIKFVGNFSGLAFFISALGTKFGTYIGNKFIK